MRLKFASVRERHNSSVETTFHYTLFVLGASKVGKTALVSQFLWEEFVKEYRPTVEEFNWIEYNQDDGGKTFLQVVFAVDDPASLDEAKDIIKEIRARNIRKAPILLVANKIDLYESEEQWATKDSRIYAIENNLHFATLSALNLFQVTEIFRNILSEIGNFQPSKLKKRRQSMPNTRGSEIEAKPIELLAGQHSEAKKGHVPYHEVIHDKI
ncbi:hypothetical protein DINM_022447 [Dirofilaria immitis]|nr:hypothetical protein [Dirofilaria immitis]